MYGLMLVIAGQIQPVVLRFADVTECRRHAHAVVGAVGAFNPNQVVFWSATNAARAWCIREVQQ